MTSSPQPPTTSPSASRIPVTLIRLDLPSGSHKMLGHITESVRPATDVTIDTTGGQVEVRVHGIEIDLSQDPSLVIKCRRTQTSDLSVIMPTASFCFRVLRTLCIGHWLREFALRKGRRFSALVIDLYVIGWTAFTCILLGIAGVLPPHPFLSTALLVLAIYRASEIWVVYLNILLFDRIRATDKGEAYIIVSSARSVFISMLSFIEIALCFALMYASLGPSYFAPAGGFAGVRDAIYFSAITVTTVGYGDIAPLYVARILAAIEAVLGAFFGMTIIARMISWLPPVADIDQHSIP